MAAVSDMVQATRASAFSNGKDQAISNTAILNAGGNIIYLEWNPTQHPNVPQTITESSHSDENTDSLPGTLDAMSGALCSLLKPRTPSPSSSCVPLGSSHTPQNLQSSVEPLQIEASNFRETVGGEQTKSVADVNSDEENATTKSYKSETDVSVTPSYKSTFIPSGALLRAPSSCEIYIEQMFPLKYGYPLWLPQPDHNLPLEYRRKGVSIGDVGIITPNGGFDFLFNIWLSAQHPINPDDLPDDFSSIPRPKQRTSFQTLFNYGGKVSSIEVETDMDTNTRDIHYTYRNCDKGAILSMPNGAYQEDLMNESELKEFIARNALSWYKYARLNCGRELDRHSLYLVAGCIKSKTWGIATFDTVVPDRHSSLVIGETHYPDGPSHIWKKPGGATSFRTGPSPHPGSISENGISASDMYNQCLFLRGFKISLSEKTWEKICDSEDTVITNENGKRPFSSDKSHEGRSSKRPRNDKNVFEAQSPSPTDLGDNITISNFPSKNTLPHPLTAINDMLLARVPEASIAITHDNLWCDIIEQGHYDAEKVHNIIQDLYVVGYAKETGACTIEPRLNMLLKPLPSFLSQNLVQHDDDWFPEFLLEPSFETYDHLVENPETPDLYNSAFDTSPEESSLQTPGFDSYTGPSTFDVDLNFPNEREEEGIPYHYPTFGVDQKNTNESGEEITSYPSPASSDILDAPDKPGKRKEPRVHQNNDRNEAWSLAWAGNDEN